MASSVGPSVWRSVLGYDIVKYVAAGGTAADDLSSLKAEEAKNAELRTARLARLFDSGWLSDVTLIVGDKQYRCHRLLLAIASSVLE